MILVRFSTVSQQSVRTMNSMEAVFDNLIFDAASRGAVNAIELPPAPALEYTSGPLDVCGWMEGKEIVADVPDLREIVDLRKTFTGEPVTVSVQVSLNAGVDIGRSLVSYTFYHTPTVLGVWPAASPDCGGTAMCVFAVGLTAGSDPRVAFEDIRNRRRVVVPGVVHVASGCVTCVSPALPGATLLAVSISLNGGQQFSEPAGGEANVLEVAEKLDSGVEIDNLQAKLPLSDTWAASANAHAAAASRLLASTGASDVTCSAPDPPALLGARPASARVCLLVRYFASAAFAIGSVGPTHGGSALEIVGGDSLRSALVDVLTVVNQCPPPAEAFTAGPTFEPAIDRAHASRALPALGAAKLSITFRGADGIADVSAPAKLSYDSGCGVFRLSCATPPMDRTRLSQLALRASVDSVSTSDSVDLAAWFWYTPSIVLRAAQPAAFPGVGGSTLRLLAEGLVCTGQAKIKFTWVGRSHVGGGHSLSWISAEVPAIARTGDGMPASLFEPAVWLECTIPPIPVTPGAAEWAAARLLVGRPRGVRELDDAAVPRVSEESAALVEPSRIPSGAAPVFVNASLNGGCQYARIAVPAQVFGQARVTSAMPYAVPAGVPNIAVDVHGASFTDTSMVSAKFTTADDEMGSAPVMQQASVSATSSSVRVDGMCFKSEGLHVVRVSQNGGQDYADGAACVMVRALGVCLRPCSCCTAQAS
jgi:hypothetical protein